MNCFKGSGIKRGGGGGGGGGGAGGGEGRCCFAALTKRFVLQGSTFLPLINF